MEIIYGGAGGVGEGRGEGGERKIYIHMNTQYDLICSLKYRNNELTRMDHSKYIITRESTLLFFFT